VDAEAVVGPVIEAEGLELVEVVLVREGGRRILRVVVDRPGGVDLDTLAVASERVSRRLDAEGFAPGGPYALEVSSPGIERPLRRPAHFVAAVGARVRVKTTTALGETRSHVGIVRRADDEGIDLDVDGGTLHVGYTDIASARTVADWDAELKRSNA